MEIPSKIEGRGETFLTHSLFSDDEFNSSFQTFLIRYGDVSVQLNKSWPLFFLSNVGPEHHLANAA